MFIFILGVQVKGKEVIFIMKVLVKFGALKVHKKESGKRVPD